MGHAPSRRFLLFASALILIPVFWQTRIQSADLASHIYNAWLALQVERGQLPGLYIAPQTTNIAFDLLLLNLLRILSPDWTQRIAVSLCVLIFFWGAYAAVRRITGRFPTYLLPLLAILSYGFVFRLGLFNFYIGMGLAFGALALLWDPPNRKWLGAILLCAFCYASHALPFAWLISVTIYVHAARHIRPRHRLWLLAAASAAILLFAVFALWKLPSQWQHGQPLMTTGADQAMVYGNQYKYLVFGWILLQVSLLLRLIDRVGVTRLVLSTPFHLCLLHAFALAAVPSLIWFPGYNTAFSLFAERMGIAQGVVAIALLARVPSHVMQRIAAAALAAVFFFWSYRDSARLNGLEDSIEISLSGLPSQSRVLSGLCYAARFNYAYHLLDRACIGRCYSYGNYEPSTTQFRLRASPGNGVVSANRTDTDAMEFGRYRVKPEDEPVFLIDNSRQMVWVRPLRTGEITSRPCAREDEARSTSGES